MLHRRGQSHGTSKKHPALHTFTEIKRSDVAPVGHTTTVLGQSTHIGVACCGCNAPSITGVRYQCSACSPGLFNLCGDCMELFEQASEVEFASNDTNVTFGAVAVTHPRSHVCSFIRIKYASSLPASVNSTPPTASTKVVTKAAQIDYEPVSADVSANYPKLTETADVSFETLIRMLQRESEVRLGEHVQQQYLTRGYEHYVDITLEAQRAVAAEFGFSPDEGVRLLQSAEYLVASDPEKLAQVRNASFYRKFNRCYDGGVRVGDVVEEPQHVLWKLARRESNVQPCEWSPTNCTLVPETLSAALQRAAGSTNKPTVIVAGSYS